MEGVGDGLRQWDDDEDDGEDDGDGDELGPRLLESSLRLTFSSMSSSCGRCFLVIRATASSISA